MATASPHGTDRIVRDIDFDYPWIDWFNGQVWALRPGEDFTDSIATFRQRCYRANRRITGKQLRLRTKFDKKIGAFLLQAFQRNDDGTWVPVSYAPAQAPQTTQAPPAPSEPPAALDAWTPAPPHQPR